MKDRVEIGSRVRLLSDVDMLDKTYKKGHEFEVTGSSQSGWDLTDDDGNHIFETNFLFLNGKFELITNTPPNESRLEILDRLSYKWSRNTNNSIPVESFVEWLEIYDSEATIRLVYIAMQEYAKQELLSIKVR